MRLTLDLALSWKYWNSFAVSSLFLELRPAGTWSSLAVSSLVLGVLEFTGCLQLDLGAASSWNVELSGGVQLGLGAVSAGSCSSLAASSLVLKTLSSLAVSACSWICVQLGPGAHWLFQAGSWRSWSSQAASSYVPELPGSFQKLPANFR